MKSVEIRVAQGVYKADQGTRQVPGDTWATFMLRNGVTLRGGYAGGEGADPNVRDVNQFQTILHGDLKDNDALGIANLTDNSQVVVTSISNDHTALLDGFTVTAGRGWSGPGISCYYSDALFLNLRITRNRSEGREGGYGGGMYIAGGEPTLMNCLFESNWALAEGGGLWCQSKARPTLIGCRLKSNTASVGGGLSVAQSDLALTNCLFENNEAGFGAGLASRFGGHALLSNCTFFGNKTPDNATLYIGLNSLVQVKNSILWNDGEEVWSGQGGPIEITYSNIQGGWRGRGNIDVDPLFASPGYWGQRMDPNVYAEPDDPNAFWVAGDYHLASETGRWDPVEKVWAIDEVSSLCIDAGNPNSPVAWEPSPHGGRVNMGAYGRTAEASKSAGIADSETL